MTLSGAIDPARDIGEGFQGRHRLAAVHLPRPMDASGWMDIEDRK
jgi:hypothetical protein